MYIYYYSVCRGPLGRWVLLRTGDRCSNVGDSKITLWENKRDCSVCCKFAWRKGFTFAYQQLKNTECKAILQKVLTFRVIFRGGPPNKTGRFDESDTLGRKIRKKAWFYYGVVVSYITSPVHGTHDKSEKHKVEGRQRLAAAKRPAETTLKKLQKSAWHEATSVVYWIGRRSTAERHRTLKIEQYRKLDRNLMSLGKRL